MDSAHLTEISSTEPSETVDSPLTTAPPEEPPLSPREKAQKVVAEDLFTWQEKFAKAADQGSDELDVRITEITDRFIQTQAQGLGEAYLVQLEETVASEIKGLKNNIISIVKQLPNENAETELSNAVRTAGIAIKEKAQAVRTWRQNYDRETNYLINNAAEETFRIIDHIRDLGLQEIGMRWAWLDGITHKDWTKYHALKDKFDEWRRDVEDVVTSHPGLAAARAASEEIEGRAMDIATDAAKELTRLKETGRWKISAGDSSDDFSTKYMPPVVADIAQKIVEKASEASEAIIGTTQGTVESLTSVVSSSVAAAASSVSSVGAAQAENVKNHLSDASEGISGFASSISVAGGKIVSGANGIVDEGTNAIFSTSQGSVESVISVVGDSSSTLVAVLSSAVGVKSPGVLENVSRSFSSAASSVSDGVPVQDLSSISDSASSLVSSSGGIVLEAVTSATSSLDSQLSSATDSASKKVWGGAMAQYVEAKQIVFDDDEDGADSSYSKKIEMLASEAGERFNEMTRAVSEALLRPTSTQGSIESVTSLASERYSKALSAASVALYGTPAGPGESIVSMVSTRYADAVAA